MKIEYCLERVEYIPVPLSCFKCYKYGNHRQSNIRHLKYGRCDQRDPDHREEDCLNETKCSNSQENHTAFSESFEIKKKEGNNKNQI